MWSIMGMTMQLRTTTLKKKSVPLKVTREQCTWTKEWEQQRTINLKTMVLGHPSILCSLLSH